MGIHLQVRPIDGFSATMAQHKDLPFWGFLILGLRPINGGKIPPKAHQGMNRRFQAKTSQWVVVLLLNLVSDDDSTRLLKQEEKKTLY